jgi:hypothetical protein
MTVGKMRNGATIDNNLAARSQRTMKGSKRGNASESKNLAIFLPKPLPA